MMKKIITFILCILPLTLSAQVINSDEVYVYFPASSITGADTVLYEWQGNEIRTKGGLLDIEVKYLTLDDTTATIAFGHSMNGDSWNELIADYTLNKNDSITIPGSKRPSTSTNSVSVFWKDMYAPDAFIPIWIKNNDVTDGYYEIRIRWHE